MRVYRPRKNPRCRRLKMTVEEFYTAAVLAFGPPPARAYEYQSRAVSGAYGVGWWIAETYDGQCFANFVRECGEAKSRAPYIFTCWHAWFESQRKEYQNEANRRSAQNRSVSTGDPDSAVALPTDSAATGS